MAEVSIDKLSLEIDYQAGKSSSSIDTLTNSLKNLKSEVPGVSENLTKTASALRSLASTAEKISGINVDESIGKFSTLIDSLGKLTSSENISKPTGLTSVLTQLRKIPKITEELSDDTIKNFTDKIKTLTTALQPLANELTKVGNVLNTLPSKLNKVSSYTAKTKENFSLLQKISSTLNFGAILAIGSKLGRMFGQFTMSSNEYIEALNLFNVSMGKSTQQAKEWIDTISTALGLDPAGMMKNMGTFNIMAEGFGLASDKAYTMSKNLTQLTYDVASFYNLDFETASQKITSAFAGKIICLIYKGLYMITLLITGTPKQVKL